MIRQFVLVVFILSFIGCALLNTPHGSYTENETPAKSADTYYKFMMWKYYEKAASFVHPEKATIYEHTVLKNKDDLNITGYQIRELILLDPDDEKESTEVTVIVTYYKYPSVSENTVILKDLWIKEGKNWFVKSEYGSEMFE